jgi:O-acetylhomoserine/O-acetylserine sulfhydrylase-like pyridoxal-dependent enzyme
MYVMLYTRLNLCYTLSILSYQYNLGKGHYKIVKNIIKYLRRTKNVFLIYDIDELVIHGYSDTSFQLDIDDRNSHSIYVITLNSCIVRWKGYK